MSRRGVWGALAGALWLWVAGCGEECVDRFDCLEKKGDPGEGKRWACVENECVAEDVTSPPSGEDAGTDAGGEPGADAGTDAGTGQDGG
jgi:hypothetical protein